MDNKKLTFSALLIALGTMTGHLIYIPVGVAKAFPVQHLINILSAVLLGPAYAVWNAFAISLLRNMLGTGSLLAFPGSMIGALIAGLLYQKFKSKGWALVGELIGTGLLGAVAAYPIARFLMGSGSTVFFFVIPFSLSAAGGAVIAYLFLKAVEKADSLSFIEDLN
ncbi:MAG: thiW protein [Halanaerobium sp. 4-GBenrich]|jgi:energy coupling factor transporter S component ThiW|uniref:Energy coupling factor transporter S component ThiW n=1 Tax=Halanaerobium congolense TaxID=54121 RepID=A0A1G6M641_9FIRM|nr:energy coupling factor transporter S component ThiW [Halanaerobium congolense]ODS50398.1 MAG: thiW protein [Halanaerobium sp. 4-GBenrich]PUU88338.1 MAG: thiW protein [Halanaerobium sp.]PTX16593.1 energy coupling factor transporter S component ThiW [Halanaerobium congolense]TDP11599.1 energy coupling factor transporter S component ThiW [Halanaerobium congolense]SDC50827.1 energy coupling factor transporter S component ThiW [Halanaerobium congolense]